MLRLIVLGFGLLVVAYMLPDLGGLFTPAHPPPPPTVVVVNEGGGGLIVLVTVLLFLAALGLATAVALWLRERGQRRLCEAAALAAGVRFHPVIPRGEEGALGGEYHVADAGRGQTVSRMGPVSR